MAHSGWDDTDVRKIGNAHTIGLAHPLTPETGRTAMLFLNAFSFILALVSSVSGTEGVKPTTNSSYLNLPNTFAGGGETLNDKVYPII